MPIKIDEIIQCLQDDNSYPTEFGEKEKEAAQNILDELKGYRIIGATRILEFCIEALQYIYIKD